MNRRGFFKTVAGAIAGAAVAPEVDFAALEQAYHEAAMPLGTRLYVAGSTEFSFGFTGFEGLSYDGAPVLADPAILDLLKSNQNVMWDGGEIRPIRQDAPEV